MKRVITSLKNANSEVLKEIGLVYPKGVEEEDLTSFPTVNGQNIRALEIVVNDTIFLVKLDDEQFFKKYVAKDDDEDEDEDEDTSDDTNDDDEELDLDEFDDDRSEDE